MLALWPVLFEDNHLLVVNKPALLPTMGVSEERESLISQAREYIGRKYHKPGKVYLGIVSRLDSLVTGVVVLARTSKAAARLTEQFRTQRVEKVYWALVSGKIEPSSGRLMDVVRKDERQQRMEVVSAKTATDGQEARLSYRVLQAGNSSSLLEVTLETGRKHQIRLQLSHAGHPILGDTKYGSGQKFPSGIALHARRLKLTHPTLQTPLEFLAPLPASWSRFVPPEYTGE